MRAVRCDVCGAKAMTAAAKCPACGHLFELRDGFGELVPLAYCSSCQSYYPEAVGECRWCGTKPERAPIAPQIWRAAGAATFVAIVGTMWVLRSKTPPDVGRVRSKPAAQSAAGNTDTVVLRTVVASADSESPRTVTDAEPVVRDSVIPVSVSNAVAPSIASPPEGSFVAKPGASSPVKSAPHASSPSHRSPWVRSFSRHWVVVRSDASPHARIVASIGPNSRVELGESRGSWRRIRAKGIAGWVEPRSSFEMIASR
jgi:ribosomal protein L40E